jgi:uncharacterized membrane protein
VKPAIIQDYIDIWDMWTNLTTWRILTLLTDRHLSPSANRVCGQKSYSSIFWTLPFLLLMVQNYYNDNSDRHWWGTYY